jgi:adenylate cyclase
MKRFRQLLKSKALQALALGLATGVGVLGLTKLGWLDTVERKSLDWRFGASRSPFLAQLLHLRPTPASRDIVLVAVNDVSLQMPLMTQQFGRWPWRRRFFAGLVQFLRACGAKVIGIDFTFAGKDLHKDDDALFAEQLAERRDVILDMGLTIGGSRFLDPAPEAALDRQLAPYAWSVVNRADVPVQPFLGVDLSEPEFVRAAAGLGSTTIREDPDGPVRTIILLQRFHQEIFPAFSLAIAARYLGAPPKAALVPGPALDFAGRHIPLDASGRLLINWHGGVEDSYPFLPAWKVFNSAAEFFDGEKPEIPPEAFRNKIVIIGPTAREISDFHANPFSGTYPGPWIHATVIDNLIRGDFMRETGQGFETGAIFILALLVAGLVYFFDSALFSSLASLGVSIAYFGTGCYLFEGRNLWAPMVAPLGAGALAFLGATLTRYVTEGREKSRYRKTLMKYVSPSLVETIMSDFDWASLRAEKKTLTVLFSDVRGFTTFSEQFPPETVVATLNELLNMMVSVIFRRQGTLDKFVGDCVMAFWGAPLVQPNHAELACRAALEMIEGLEKLNQKWQSEGRPTLKIGVGINTGEMLFGNIGSEQRMDFTVIGDSVNLGSRLESSTKELHASIVISNATYQLVRDQAVVRALGEISVKGKAQKVLVYELLGMNGGRMVQEDAPIEKAEV